MAYQPENPNGQATMANSEPVVIASDQTAVPVSASSLPLPTGAATEATLDTTNTEIGGLTETAPASDTASSGLNGRLQRIAQRLTSILAKQPALGTAGSASTDVITVQGIASGTVIPVSAASLPLPSGAATETTLGTTNTEIGGLTETAPTTDTGSSGLNGRLQRIAQRLSTLITAVGSPFQAGGSIGNTSFASTQSGTWTVQPGNTANTTAWKVDGSAVNQPVDVIAVANIYNGKTTVATAGTRVTLASSQAVRSVTIKALAANTGIIYVGNSSVSSTTGFQLYAGDTVTLDIANLNTVNLDSSVNGEGVTYIGVG